MLGWLVTFALLPLVPAGYAYGLALIRGPVWVGLGCALVLCGLGGVIAATFLSSLGAIMLGLGGLCLPGALVLLFSGADPDETLAAALSYIVIHTLLVLAWALGFN